MNLRQLNAKLGLTNTRENPWQYKGAADVSAAKTTEEALNAAGMNWRVAQEAFINPRTHEDTGFVLNFRDDNDGLLGIVGKNYKPVHNKEAFDFVDGLTPNGVTFETVGMSKKGNRLWMCVKIDEAEILGDTIDNYIVMSNYHDGTGALTAAMTPSRRWCHNCLSWVFKAERGAQRVVKLHHTGNVADKMSEAQKVFGLTQQYMDALAVEAAELSKIKIAAPKFDTLAEQLFPILEEDTTKRAETQERHRYLLKQAWEIDDLANHKGTGWGFMNAVADYEQHSGRGGETVLNTVVDGSKLLQTAYQLVQTI